MVEQRFKIIVTGETTAGVDTATACANFARVFKMHPRRAQTVLQSAPSVVKRHLDKPGVRRFAAAFAQAGVAIRVELDPAVQQEHLTIEEPQANTAAGMNTAAPIERASTATGVARSGLRFTTEGSEEFGFLSVTLPEGETLWVDATSVVSSDAGITLNSHDTSVRKFKGADGMYISECTSVGGNGEISLSPSLPGEIVHLNLNGQSIYIESRVFLASTAGVGLEEERHPRHLTPMLRGYIHCFGDGDLWLQICGSVLELRVHEQYNCKASHLVAWSDGLTLGAGRGPMPGTFITATGSGTLWLQSQSGESLASWAQQFA